MKGGRLDFSRLSEKTPQGDEREGQLCRGACCESRWGGEKEMGSVCRSEGCRRAGDGQHPLI